MKAKPRNKKKAFAVQPRLECGLVDGNVVYAKCPICNEYIDGRGNFALPESFIHPHCTSFIPLHKEVKVTLDTILIIGLSRFINYLIGTEPGVRERTLYTYVEDPVMKLILSYGRTFSSMGDVVSTIDGMSNVLRNKGIVFPSRLFDGMELTMPFMLCHTMCDGVAGQVDGCFYRAGDRAAYKEGHYKRCLALDAFNHDLKDIDNIHLKQVMDKCQSMNLDTVKSLDDEAPTIRRFVAPAPLRRRFRAEDLVAPDPGAEAPQAPGLINNPDMGQGMAGWRQVLDQVAGQVANRVVREQMGVALTNDIWAAAPTNGEQVLQAPALQAPQPDQVIEEWGWEPDEDDE